MLIDYGDDTENNASLRCYASARAHHIVFAAVMTRHCHEAITNVVNTMGFSGIPGPMPALLPLCNV
jgi:hypothetical protein